MTASILGVAVGLFIVLLVVLALLTLAIIVWSWKIAVGKGYPGAVGLLLTVFFHLLGLIVLLLLPSRSSVERAFSPARPSGPSR